MKTLSWITYPYVITSLYKLCGTKQGEMLNIVHTITMNGTEAFKPEKDLKAHTIDTIEVNI